MRRPRAIFRLDDGREVALGHEDTIGRGAATLRLDDAHIPQLAAVVTLRGGRLKLRALGADALIARGAPAREARLFKGAKIGLSGGVTLRVVALDAAQATAGLRVDGRVHPLICAAYAFTGDPPALAEGLQIGAEVTVWSDAEGRYRWRRGAEDTPLEPGQRFEVRGRAVEVVPVTVREAGVASTAHVLQLDAPLTFTLAEGPAAAIRAPEGDPVRLSGQQASLLHALAGGDVYWKELVRPVLTRRIHADSDLFALRKRLDNTSDRLAGKLRDAGLRHEIIERKGDGTWALQLREGDRVVDER